MGRRLSKQDREWLERDLAAAEPYSEAEMMTLHFRRDPARVRATMAKKFLEEAADEEETNHGQR